LNAEQKKSINVKLKNKNYYTWLNKWWCFSEWSSVKYKELRYINIMHYKGHLFLKNVKCYSTYSIIIALQHTWKVTALNQVQPQWHKTTCLILLTTGKGQVTANREVLSQHLTGGINKNPERKNFTIAEIPTGCKSQFRNILKTNTVVKLYDPFHYNFPTKLFLLILHNSKRATNFYYSMWSTFSYIQNKWI